MIDVLGLRSRRRDLSVGVEEAKKDPLGCALGGSWPTIPPRSGRNLDVVVDAEAVEALIPSNAD